LTAVIVTFRDCEALVYTVQASSKANEQNVPVSAPLFLAVLSLRYRFPPKLRPEFVVGSIIGVRGKIQASCPNHFRLL
jgi:hypothetical protein